MDCDIGDEMCPNGYRLISNVGWDASPTATSISSAGRTLDPMRRPGAQALKRLKPARPGLDTIDCKVYDG